MINLAILGVYTIYIIYKMVGFMTTNKKFSKLSRIVSAAIFMGLQALTIDSKQFNFTIVAITFGIAILMNVAAIKESYNEAILGDI